MQENFAAIKTLQPLMCFISRIDQVSCIENAWIVMNLQIIFAIITCHLIIHAFYLNALGYNVGQVRIE